MSPSSRPPPASSTSCQRRSTCGVSSTRPAASCSHSINRGGRGAAAWPQPVGHVPERNDKLHLCSHICGSTLTEATIAVRSVTLCRSHNSSGPSFNLYPHKCPQCLSGCLSLPVPACSPEAGCALEPPPARRGAHHHRAAPTPAGRDRLAGGWLHACCCWCGCGGGWLLPLPKSC